MTRPARPMLIGYVALTALILAVFDLIPSGPSQAQVNEDDPGLLAFNGSCGTCHSLRPDDNRLGPTLHGIIGRKSGAIQSYGNYSSAMQQAGVVWDEKTLDAFIDKPDVVVPGNGMKPYGGNDRADIRAQIVGFIKACERCSPECPAPKKCTPQPN